MRINTKNDWVALRDRVAALQVIKCRMVHEQVRRRNGVVQLIDQGEVELGVVRIGFCAPEVRRKRLACGHTMARYQLRDALDALHTAGEVSEESHVHWCQELDEISNAIHLLDHRKGDAEKRLALAASSQSEETRQEVRALEQEHALYVGQIGRLQQVVLEHLDTHIASL